MFYRVDSFYTAHLCNHIIFVGSQAWARNIVNSMMDLGIDRDFFIALSAGVFLYFTCAVILVRSRSEVHEKYVSVFSSNQKLSW